jgi:hypothetical protein
LIVGQTKKLLLALLLVFVVGEAQSADAPPAQEDPLAKATYEDLLKAEGRLEQLRDSTVAEANTKITQINEQLAKVVAERTKRPQLSGVGGAPPPKAEVKK